MTMIDHGTSVRGGTDWRADAACRDLDTNLFYTVEREGGPTRRAGDFKLGRIKSAKSYCEQCPVRTACLQFAIDVDDRFGIYGGLTPEERKQVQR